MFHPLCWTHELPPQAPSSLSSLNGNELTDFITQKLLSSNLPCWTPLPSSTSPALLQSLISSNFYFSELPETSTVNWEGAGVYTIHM